MRGLREGTYSVDDWEDDGPPYREIWGFRTRRSTAFRDAPSMRKAKEIADRFLRDNAGIFNLKGRQKTLCYQEKLSRRSLGGWHVLYKQYHPDTQHPRRHPVYRAYVSVHLDNEGRVYLAYGRPAPKPQKPPQEAFSPEDLKRATKAAWKAIAKKEHSRKGGTRRARQRQLAKIERTFRAPKEEELWFPEGKQIWPGFRLYFRRSRLGFKPFRRGVKRPKRIINRAEYVVCVTKIPGRKPWVDDFLKNVDGLGRVFDPNPVGAPGNYTQGFTKGGYPKWAFTEEGNPRKWAFPHEAYRTVRLRDLSRSGRLTGPHVTTRPTEQREKRRRH